MQCLEGHSGQFKPYAPFNQKPWVCLRSAVEEGKACERRVGHGSLFLGPDPTTLGVPVTRPDPARDTGKNLYPTRLKAFEPTSVRS